MQQNQLEKIARAFSNQSSHFDEDEEINIILAEMRAQVRRHVLRYLRPRHRMLELNAGTGLDAIFFSSHCKQIVATDIASGMIQQLQEKVQDYQASNIQCHLLSYSQLDQLGEGPFDYVFSNFGGLNCIDDLSQVAQPISDKLVDGAYLTLVIMPPFCIWEMVNVFKGNFRLAFRRLKKGGTRSHLEGEYFQTYYFSPKQVMQAFGNKFRLVKLEGLGVFLPQPHQQNFPFQHPKIYSLLKQLDRSFRNYFLFNRWGDHYIITLQFSK